MLKDNDIEVKFDPEEAKDAPSNFKHEIKRSSTSTWHSINEGQSNIYTLKAKVAGKFKVRAMFTLNGSDVDTGEKDLEVMFPSYSDIVADSTVKDETNQAWTKTKNDTTSTRRREVGFWIFIDTENEVYEVGPTIYGPFVANDEGAYIYMGAKPGDTPTNPSLSDSPKYLVASFHTHTPMTYRTNYPSNTVRPVGPSQADKDYANNSKIPMVVYDYSSAVSPGHDINAPAKRYDAGPTRRETP